VTWILSATPAAEADIAEAVEWYEDQEPGLGARLLDEVNGLNDRIVANPLQSTGAFAKRHSAAFLIC
jgi:hypothetical protein